MDVNFAKQSYRSDSLPLSAQRLVNAYCELQPPDAKDQAPVFGAPGISVFATVGKGPIRGGIEMNGVAYFVSGTEFYSVDSAGDETLLGTGITGNAVVQLAGNGTQIVIVNGVSGFVYNDSTGVFAEISDGDFNIANTVTFIDGYFVFDWAGTNKFFPSDLLDGTSYDALQFASAESSPDRVLACWNRKSVLVVFGETTIEFWDHTGASSFPFQKYKGATLDRGLGATQAVATEDEAVYFLGNDLVFYRMQGSSLQRVSTHAIEKAWKKYTTTSDAYCFTMACGGHKWVYVTFPTEGATWATDIAASHLWHERVSFDSSGAEVKWRVNCAIDAYGQTLVGDANGNKIGTIEPTVYTEFGDPIIMVATAPVIHAKGRPVSMPMFELDMDAGVGLTTGQGSDPQAMLDFSDDGGRTWSAPQLWRSMGKTGEYGVRLQWDRLGSFFQRVMRVSVSDPVRRVIKGARVYGLKVG